MGKFIVMLGRLRDTSAWRAIRRTRLLREIHHLKARVLVPQYRMADKQAQADFERFCEDFGGAGLSAKLSVSADAPKAIVYHFVTLPYAGIEALVEKAMQLAGFVCVPVGGRTHDVLRYDWLVGNEAGYLHSDFPTDGDPAWVDLQVRALRTTRDWLALTYNNVRVGQYVIATALRVRKAGRLDFEDAATRALLSDILDNSIRLVISGGRLLDEIKPKCLLFMDKGYSGAGELFDLALQRDIDVVTWNLGYKSNCLVLKRYNSRNDREHPLSPSSEAWEQMSSLPWSRALGDEIRNEIFSCYKNQDLFSFVGTQFNKSILSQESTRRELGLATDKKVAVIYPHILWDGSFFFGEDLFQDYTEWLIETVKAACANDRLQWVVKLHPAHVVKAEREGYHGKPAELEVLESAIGDLPPHITFVAPEAPISTYSLMQIADYVVTVRGTVGIEAALLGIPSLTAGTGRYDRRGFTIDSSSREEYLARLAELETYLPLTVDQIELAERYAYYAFLCRPLKLSSASLEYARDGKATPILTVHCRTAEQWASSPDMAALADWFRDGVAEDFAGAPLPSGSSDAVAPRCVETIEA